MDYLGRYSHRTALTDGRLLGFDGEQVHLAYKDYRDGNKRKVMTLDAEELLCERGRMRAVSPLPPRLAARDPIRAARRPRSANCLQNRARRVLQCNIGRRLAAGPEPRRPVCLTAAACGPGTERSKRRRLGRAPSPTAEVARTHVIPYVAAWR